MPEASVGRIVQAVRDRAYRLTDHAEYEREADAISVVELEQAFGSEILELLENYPEDPRGSSALLLGFTSEGNPLHAVVSVSSPDIVVFITLYRPDPTLWHNWRRRV